MKNKFSEFVLVVIVLLGLWGVIINPPPFFAAWPPYGARVGISILAMLWTWGFLALTIIEIVSGVKAKGKPDKGSRVANSWPDLVRAAWELGVFRGGMILAIIFLLLRSEAPELTLEEALLNTFGWAFLIGVVMAASVGIAQVAQWGMNVIRQSEIVGDNRTPDGDPWNWDAKGWDHPFARATTDDEKINGTPSYWLAEDSDDDEIPF